MGAKVYKSLDELTPKQHKWLVEYLKTGEASTAAVRAGYSPNTAHAQGSAIKKQLAPLLKERMKEVMLADSMDLQEIFALWSKIGRDADESTKSRLKATELLAKALGGFVEKVEVKQVDSEWFK